MELALGLTVIHKSTEAGLGTKVGRGLINLVEPVYIMAGEFSHSHYIVNHQIAFKIILKRIAINTAICIYNIYICINNIAEHRGNFLVFHIVKPLQYSVNFSCSLQKSSHTLFPPSYNLSFSFLAQFILPQKTKIIT